MGAGVMRWVRKVKVISLEYGFAEGSSYSVESCASFDLTGFSFLKPEAFCRLISVSERASDTFLPQGEVVWREEFPNLGSFIPRLKPAGFRF